MAYEMVFHTWLPVASLVLLISLAFISFFYMIARALDNDNLKRWAQNEIYQIFASAFLLGSAVLMITIVNSIMYQLITVMNPTLDLTCSADGCTFNKLQFQSYGLVIGDPKDLKNNIQMTQVNCGGETSPCHIMIAISQLDQLYDIIRYYLGNKIVTAGWINILAGAKVGFNTFTVAPLAVLSNISYIYSEFIKIGFNILILLKANSLFLLFVLKMFPAFIIAGLILRSISLFRGVGGLLFAVAIGTYFIYPMLLIFSMTLMAPSSDSFVLAFSDNSKFISEDVSYLSQPPPSLTDGGVVLVSDAIKQEDLTWYNKLAKFFGDLTTKFVFIETPTGNKVDFISYTIFRTIMPGGFIDNISFLSIWVFVPFIISLYALIAFIKEFSAFVGGDIDIAGFSKLI